MQGYDVIVVGAGSAGCVVAARLSEDPSCRVLLLEAGPDYWPGGVFPELVDGLHGPRILPTYDWGLSGCAGVDERIIELPRGRVMGGSSAVNAAFALRGSVLDYDGWAALGNAGWSHDELLPSLCRLERDLDFGAEAHHGTTGPIPIQRLTSVSMWAEAATAALTGAGLRAVEDLNAPGAVGVGRPPVNVLDGRRMSTSIAYIDPVRDLPNLDVRAGVLVDRVAFDGARTTGVVLADGETIAAAEVVLAAGAFMSPAILLRSGIGAADDVRALGAGVVADLSGVGRNLADHPAVSIDLAYPLPLGEHSLFETVATLHSSHVDKESSPPDLQILAGGPFPHDDGSAVCFMAASVLKPASRGSVRVTSPDPAAPPVIDLGYYRKEGDLSRLFEGLEVVETALAQSSVGTVTAGRLTPRMRDDADGRREALARTWTYYHPVGTAAMGPDPEAGAVVDPQCRVHGVEGLSVVDASVMPDIVAANTSITTIAIAERYVELRSRAAVPAARAGSDTAVRA